MESKLPFTRKNYQLMIIGLVTLVVGFTIMSIDRQDYGFGFLGLTLGPLVVVVGFILQIFAILYRENRKK
jgi:uncharacterized membrane protein HdeD (DUF308 family)